MGFLRSRLVGALPGIVLVMAYPAVASACGYCTDTMIEQHGWWTVFPFWVAGALLVDLVWVSVARMLRHESGHERIWPMMVALGLGLLIAIAGGGLIAFAFIVSIPLLARLVRSLRERAKPGDRRLLRVRVAVLALAVGASAFLSRPAAISTETLIHRELHGAVSLELVAKLDGEGVGGEAGGCYRARAAAHGWPRRSSIGRKAGRASPSTPRRDGWPGLIDRVGLPAGRGRPREEVRASSRRNLSAMETVTATTALSSPCPRQTP